MTKGRESARGGVVRVIVSATALLWATADAFAQQRLDVRGAAVCATCRIEIRHVATLDVAAAGGLRGLPSSIARDRAGRYWVGPRRAGEPPLLFAPNGGFVRRVGRAGAGPSEYRGRLEIGRSAADSIYILDYLGQRVTVLSPLGDFVRTAPAQVRNMFRAVVTTSGRIVVNAELPTRDQAGYPLHLYVTAGDSTLTGAPVRSFGAEVPIMRRDAPPILMRFLVPAEGDQVWSVLPTRYVMELWAPNGSKVRELTRHAEWFKPHWQVHQIVRYDNEEYLPYIEAVGISQGGLLWVSLAQPKPEWRSAFGPPVPAPPDGKPRRRIQYPERLLSHRMEVIDPRNGSVLVSEPVERAPTFFLDDGYAVHAEATADGDIVLKVVRYTLRGQ